jgi:repressor LexA
MNDYHADTDYTDNDAVQSAMTDRLPVTALPKKQRHVLEAILTFLQSHGYPPTIQQLCQACGVTSTSTIHYHLTALKAKGFIHWNESERRAITVRDDLVQAATSNTEVLFSSPTLPVMGTIAAGSPMQALTEISDQWAVGEPWVQKGCYALRVKGDSMIDDHIAEGDLVIINPDTATIRQGDVVVALVDGETVTLKRYFKESDGKVRLQPANSTMDPIMVWPEQVIFQGKMEALVRLSV